MKKQAVDFHFLWLTIVALILGICYAKLASAKDVRTVRLNNKTVARISVSSRGTVLNFPVRPTKVILFRKGSFGIEYVENDLAISPLSANAKSNLLVYLEGRRFAFFLSTSDSLGDDIVLVRDVLDEQIKVKIK